MKFLSFEEFVGESFIDTTTKPEQVDFEKKKMLKNGYIEVVVKEPVEGLEKGDVVFALSNEFGQIGNNALIKVLKDEKDKKGVIIPIENLKLK
jgi:hypothetical protein